MGNSASSEKAYVKRSQTNLNEISSDNFTTSQNDPNCVYLITTPTDVLLEFGSGKKFSDSNSTGQQQIRDVSDSLQNSSVNRPTNVFGSLLNGTAVVQPHGSTKGQPVTSEWQTTQGRPLSSFTHAYRHDWSWSSPNSVETGKFPGRDCNGPTKDYWPNCHTTTVSGDGHNAAVFTHFDTVGINRCQLSRLQSNSLPSHFYSCHQPYQSYQPYQTQSTLARRRNFSAMELPPGATLRYQNGANGDVFKRTNSHADELKRSKLTLPLIASPTANDSGFVYTTLRAKTPQTGGNLPFVDVCKEQNSVEKGPSQRRRQPLLYRNPSLPKSFAKPAVIHGEQNNNERFEDKDVFSGQELIDWIAAEVLTDKHYLRRLVTKQDFQLLITELCSRLIVLGVVICTQQFSGIRFKPEFNYYWSGEKTAKKEPTDKQLPKVKVGRSLTFLDKSHGQSPINEYTTLKYTEQDFQAVLMGIKREHKEALDDLNDEHQSDLSMLNDKKLSVVRGYEVRIKQLRKRLELYEPSGRFDSPNSSDLDTIDIVPTCHRCQLRSQRSIECQTELKSISNTMATQTDSIQIHREIQTDFEPILINSHTHLEGISIPHGIDDCNSDCRSSISVDSAFCDDSQLPGVSDSHSVAPPAPPPPPLPLTLGRKVGFHLQTAETSRCRKPVVNPKVPMKPLYWKRIQLPNATKVASKNLWSELEEVEIDEDELCDLFSRVNPPNMQNLTNSPSKRMSICAKRETMKVLDDKRSEALGILIQSKHLDLSEIACAVFNCDTSLVSIEVLQRLYQQRPTPDELHSIKTHLDSGSVVPLDRPEQFLWELSQIPQLEWRIQAIVIQATLPEKFYDIDHRLNAVLSVCKSLRHNKPLQHLLSLILHVGNYLNGQSSDRGQADGFGLDILPKLKDLKGKDNITTVLNYVCRTFMKRFHGDSLKANTGPPIGESADFRDVAGVNFSDVEISFDQLGKEMDLWGRKVNLVMEQSDGVHKSPFREIMADGLKKAETTLENLRRLLIRVRSEFDSTTSFFHWTPPQLSPNGPNNNSFATREFFSVWAVFAADLKHSWKREKEKILRSAIESHRKAATLPHLSNAKRSRSVSSYLSHSATLHKKTMSKDTFMTAINKIMTDGDSLLE